MEFFAFPYEHTDENGNKTMVDRESSERDHRVGYTERADLAETLGGTSAYMRHERDFHTVLVFAEERAVFITTIGRVSLSDGQLETLALSLAE